MQQQVIEAPAISRSASSPGRRRRFDALPYLMVAPALLAIGVFSLAPTVADGRSWLAIEATGFAGSLAIGSAFTATLADVSVTINTATGATALDWADVTGESVTLPTLTTEFLNVSGSLTSINLAGLVSGSADFSVTKESVSVDLGGGPFAATLLAIEPLLAAAWRDGSLSPLLIGCVGVPPFCFYLDDPARGQHWQSAVSPGLLQALRAQLGELASPAPGGLVGISMGGYGALKLAFEQPSEHAAVAAIAPMLEPHTRAERVPPRNRYHYPDAVPQQLLGPGRDPELFAADHPVSRARRNAGALRESGLAIYLDAGSCDVLHAHDGAEYLHRALWELDIAHDYHLLRSADHVGPTLPGRLLAGFQWIARHAASRPAAAPSQEEQELAEYLAPLQRAASQEDPTFGRTYGVL